MHSLVGPVGFLLFVCSTRSRLIPVSFPFVSSTGCDTRGQVTASVHIGTVVPSSKASRSRTLWMVILSMLYGEHSCKELDLQCPIPGRCNAKGFSIICLASYSKLQKHQWRKQLEVESWVWPCIQRKKKTPLLVSESPFAEVSKPELGRSVQTLKQRNTGAVCGKLRTLETVLQD